VTDQESVAADPAVILAGEAESVMAGFVPDEAVRVIVAFTPAPPAAPRAVIVALPAVEIVPAVAPKAALLWPARTLTEAGTAKRSLLLVRPTT
jgi:hypothetical protein